MNYKFYDFFAGGGMAGFGLGSKWSCVFANDIDERKASAYRENNGGGRELLVRDIAEIATSDIYDTADLAWASFPCQDLSLAGSRAGLKGKRSGTFWSFWNLMRGLRIEEREPRLLVLENVYGAIRSEEGRDFLDIANSVAALGYRIGALIVDAAHFVPQSRPRLFLIAAKQDLKLPESIISTEPSSIWHPRALIDAYSKLPPHIKDDAVFWHLPSPATRNQTLSGLIEDEPEGVEWHSQQETEYILSLMSDVNLSKVRSAMLLDRQVIGTVYKRTRKNRNGDKIQRAEVRFDEIAGCLRTPSGGSSRQTILVVEGNRTRSRLLSPREAARLMGLPEDYKLPERYNDAYHLAGDGVVVDVVRHLSENVLEPILQANSLRAAA